MTTQNTAPLTEAVGAAEMILRARLGADVPRYESALDGWSRDVIAAALPYIREQIARDIEALGVRRHTDRVSGVTSIQYAARIARDGAA